MLARAMTTTLPTPAGSRSDPRDAQPAPRAGAVGGRVPDVLLVAARALVERRAEPAGARGVPDRQPLGAVPRPADGRAHGGGGRLPVRVVARREGLLHLRLSLRRVLR